MSVQLSEKEQMRDDVHVANLRRYLIKTKIGKERSVRDRLCAQLPEVFLPLPVVALRAYTTFTVMVRRWSTIRIVNHTYSVPARLIGERVRVPSLLRSTRGVLRGQADGAAARPEIDYHRVISSLVKKPGAFARYRLREADPAFGMRKTRRGDPKLG